MRKKTNTVIGLISLTQGLLYVFGFWLLILFMQPIFNEQASPISQLNFAIEHKLIYQFWMTCIYIVFGLLLIPMAIGINDLLPRRLQASLLARTALTLALIWAAMLISCGMIAVVGIETIAQQDEKSVVFWQLTKLIQQSLGGDIEIVGGIWVLLISFMALKGGFFTPILNYFGILVGVFGILSLVPNLKDAAALFGMAQILWFVGVGLILIFSGRSKPVNTINA